MIVQIGSTVTWKELPLDRTFTRTIVRPQAMKSDRLTKDMPANAPIGKAMIGKQAGDAFAVETPYATKQITILEVR